MADDPNDEEPESEGSESESETEEEEDTVRVSPPGSPLREPASLARLDVMRVWAPGGPGSGVAAVCGTQRDVSLPP